MVPWARAVTQSSRDLNAPVSHLQGLGSPRWRLLTAWATDTADPYAILNQLRRLRFRTWGLQ
jgi:hypothetical protein